MKIILMVFLSLLAFACSGEVENNQTPKNKSTPTDIKTSKPLTLQPQPKQTEEHISGVGEPRISGAPSSSHISGQ
ncbi:MAG: hypothetical protein ACI9UO_001725 [Nitrospinales bacterium]|jgi:hypothetical protein